MPLRRRGSILELAQERVTHTRLGQWHLLVAGTHRVLVEARRAVATGELAWFVTASSGDHDMGAHVERAIARLSADLGLTPQPGTGLSLSLAPGGSTAEAG